jgi:hypothetical protein
MTTLSTPHHGSVGADYYFASIGANPWRSDNKARVLAAQYLRRQEQDDTAKFDLTQDRVEDFNGSNILPASFRVAGDDNPIPVKYYSLGSDVRMDQPDQSVPPGAKLLTQAEAAGADAFSNANLNAIACSLTYALMGNVASVEAVPGMTRAGVPYFAVKESANAVFQRNDLLVTINSSRYVNQARPETSYLNLSLDPGVFTNPPDPLSIANQSTLPPANHATIANETMGSLVIEAIQHTQPIQ